MSHPAQRNAVFPRLGKSPGKLRSAHLAAIIGVKNLTTFRDVAKSDSKTPLFVTATAVPTVHGLLPADLALRDLHDRSAA